MHYCINSTQRWAFSLGRHALKVTDMNQPIRTLARDFRGIACGLLILLVAAGTACVRSAAAHSTALDPLYTDGDKYHLLFENQLVRVLRYHDEPGVKTSLHHHPCFVLYALGPFKRELAFADGSHRSREFRLGDTAWMPAQSHAGHNIGDTPTDALLVELKGPCG